jgi:perosamine synthetase
MIIPWWQVKIDENSAQAAYNAILQGKLSMGSITEEFEAEVSKFLGTEHAIAVNSGSSALLLSLLSLNLEPDDEILVQNRSWIAAAHAVKILGAKPILVDVEESSPIISLADLEKKITERTKAIIVVHMNGRCSDLKQLRRIASDNKIYLIEDAAQALGSKFENRYLGTFGELGCFSLSIAKIIGSGQGGFIVTDSKERAELLRKLRIHGMDDTKEANWYRCGFNFRFADPLAAIALSELKHLPARLIRQKEVYKIYESAISRLARVNLITTQVHKEEIGPYIEVLVDNRFSFMEFMKTQGIDTRSFYPSISRATYIGTTSECVNTEKFAKYGVYLPSGPSITNMEIDKVIHSLREYENFSSRCMNVSKA